MLAVNPIQVMIKMTTPKHAAEATNEALHRIFTIAEAPDSTLGRIEQEISENLIGFLNNHIVASKSALSDIEQDFYSARIPEQPEFVSDHMHHLLDKLVAHSVNTASPSFIGHMT